MKACFCLAFSTFSYFVLNILLCDDMNIFVGDFMKIGEVKGAVILDVYVKPRSSEFKIVVEGDEIVVFCREEPIKGKVNKEIIKEFSRLFHNEVELVSGFASKQKKLLIRGIGKVEVERVLLHK